MTLPTYQISFNQENIELTQPVIHLKMVSEKIFFWPKVVQKFDPKYPVKKGNKFLLILCGWWGAERESFKSF